VSWFLLAVLVTAVLSGGTATITGFGIGSLLTPVLATRLGMTAAVVAVAIPHALATAVRCWRLRRSIDWSVLRTFGVLSALGGLVGAFLYTQVSNRSLSLILGLLLIATALAGVTNWTKRVRVHPAGAAALGALSGLFGGVAGNQGGLRAAALMAFPLAPLAFVATSTATGLLVDAARLPVYLWRAGPTMLSLATPIAVACLGVLIGTLAGERILLGMTHDRFRSVVSILIGLLGAWLLVTL
jgi:uncharacterized membrane protein YfcA